MNTSLTPVGIIVVILYFGAMLAVTRWMVTTFPHLGPQMSRARQPYASQNRIIVPLTDIAGSTPVIELACRLASEHHAAIILAHVIEIPMTLGLDIPLEAAEENGRLLLEAGESIAKEFDLPVECRLLRHRTTAQALAELARETDAEAIVVGAGNAPWWSFVRIERTVAELLRRAPCQVIVAKSPRTGLEVMQMNEVQTCRDSM